MRECEGLAPESFRNSHEKTVAPRVAENIF